MTALTTAQDAKADFENAQEDRMIEAALAKTDIARTAWANAKRYSPKDVLSGTYGVTGARETRFFKIDRPTKGKWTGYTFIREIDGPHATEGPTIRDNRLKAYVLHLIAADPHAALASYGHRYGICGICGRTLSDPESVARGIGPICAGKY